MIDLIRICSGKNRSALIWAEEAHKGQTRAGTGAGYLLHMVTVASVLAGAGADRNLVCAGALHDVVEDTDKTLEDIEREFGAEVARLVGAVTKEPGIRLEDQAGIIETRLMEVGYDAVALKAADLLANITDIVLDAENGIHPSEVFGENRWQRKLCHYYHLSYKLSDRLNESGKYVRLSDALDFRTRELWELYANAIKSCDYWNKV